MQWIDTEIATSVRRTNTPVDDRNPGRLARTRSQILSGGGLARPADLLIAATARVHDLILVTRNARDFAGTGVVVYDPWTGKTHTTGTR